MLVYPGTRQNSCYWAPAAGLVGPRLRAQRGSIGLEQLLGADLQRGCDSMDVVEAGIALAPFDAADVVPVEPGLLREILLGPSPLQAQLSDGRAERLTCCTDLAFGQSRHDADRKDHTYRGLHTMSVMY